MAYPDTEALERILAEKPLEPVLFPPTSKELKWHRRFLDMCDQVSQWSKDPSTKVGAVIVKDRHILSTGYNGLTPGIDDEDPYYQERPRKYSYAEHAERNALYSALKNHTDVNGAILYLNGVPCCDCARGIVMSGVATVVWPANNPFETPGELNDRWRESLEASLEILNAGGVSILRVE